MQSRKALPPALLNGAYREGINMLYVGVEVEPPDHPTLQFYDEKTRRTGTLNRLSAHHYRSDGSPTLAFVLDSPVLPVAEDSFVIGRGDDRLGASLWHAPRAVHRPTIVLVHGADDETRDMGFLVPYFVSHGLNVITYDQRGTGKSTGNWRYTSPQSKADDIVAILKTIQTNAAVAPDRIGIWGFSNGGWVAPIVADRLPLAFMVLKSAASETIAENVLYEIRQDLLEQHTFSSEQISAALSFEKMMFAAIQTNSGWDAAGKALDAAQKQPWFASMRIPPGMTTPPQPPVLDAFRAALIYDPIPTLERIHLPTLAIFGALDKNVDSADSAARFREAFHRSGMKDLTILTLPGAGHTLVSSKTGYEDETSLPESTVQGYPEAILHWLAARNFAQ